MLKWRKKHLPNQYKKTIFYPFSGPDILHGLTFYPQGTDFLMFGLEKIGHIPDPLSMDRKRRLRDLRGLPVALNFILNHNFFITRYMLKRIGRTSYSGITGVMMFFLARNGYTIKDVKKFVLNDGRLYYKTKLVSPQKNKDLSRTPETVNGVEIIFYKNKKQLRRLRFVKINIENKSKQIDNFLDFLQTYPSMSTMIKSASYLMHLKSFSKIRNAILKKSVSVLEDDSGIPYRKFDKNVWKISYFGKYHVPIRVFKGFTQKDLSRAIDKHSPGLLPFSYGYGFKFIDMTYHLIYAQKKSYVKSLSAKK